MLALLNKVLILGLILNLNYKLLIAAKINSLPPASQNVFAADLFSVIVDQRPNENVIYSPASIQTCLALAFMGAEGKTDEEMRQVLKLGNDEKSLIAQRYGEFLKTTFVKSNEEAPKLRMANGLYVNDQYKVKPQFNVIAQNDFHSSVESLDFSKGEQVAKKINTWVEQQTENKIKDLLKPNVINVDTTAILVNAIYFKAKWLNPFSEDITRKMPFHLNKKQSKNVDMMTTDDEFNYVELPELNAKALELPYENSDISMLIILPNDVEGLKTLEQQLKGKDLNEISAKMSKHDVDVYLPKFRIEFDIDMKEPLEKMGLSTMFSSSADFNGLFDSVVPLKISEVKHKAFLEVNEAGSEAAAATYMKISTHSLNFDQKTFRADHPFVFAIRSKTSVYFAGHVAKLE